MEEKSEENQTRMVTPDSVDISGTIRQIMFENDLKVFEPEVIQSLEAFAESNIYSFYLFHILTSLENSLYYRHPYKS